MTAERDSGDPTGIIQALPLWSGPVAVEPLPGGLSNANFKVADGERRCMVRLGDDLPFHRVFREQEARVSRAAHAAGVSPALIHADDGVMVFELLEARTYGEADVRAQWRRILPLLRRCHDQVGRHLAGPAPFFWVFHVIRDYAATLRAGGSRMTGDLPRLLAVAEGLEAAQVAMPVVFGHHDLLAANLLDDGTRIWLVDWEYGGFGTPLFDLANLAGNAGMPEADERALLAAYFGQDPDPALWRAYRAMKVASLLRETLWSLVSELHMGAPGVDYAAYTAENLARFETALAAFEESER
ncbi:choline/ethanolamine kinase family protein [Thalassobaculum sp.]|uniref:choline/ethanolamine kinase family protein n=1 Tax=Thalassobaculum sp. TaxID=2022740 RepID=UPI0032EC4BE1